ncbi:MAG: hypothetical protein KatS3mg013_1013 [Actinomycetota bacterium]|jgi:hypothetical protein|nr:MAG: hypothetical protein KatS3mg013_1013 [Actinomycetota bacterium]
MRTWARPTTVGTLAALAVTLLAPAVRAAPPSSSTADNGVFMVDGPVVNDVVVVGGNAWIGGAFSEVQDQSGSRVAGARGLTVFGPTGQLVGSIHASLPELGGTSPTVFDLSLGPNGTLYAAGKFTYTVGGKTYKNLVGIDPATGGVVATYIANPLKSVLATSDYVYGGGRKLWRFKLGGGPASDGWHTMTAYVDGSLRGHTIQPAFREIELASATRLIVVGQFDWIDGTGTANQKKVAVMVNVATGQPDLGTGSWTLGCSCARQESAAFGHAVDVDATAGIAYVGAGGNDWLAAVRLSDGSVVWQTDTNGSVQDLAVYDAETLIVGGHWTYIELVGPNDQSGSECPSRTSSDPGTCWAQPRLAALSRANGLPHTSWTPAPCCKYRGIWATTVEGARVHVGGEFTKLDTESGPERFYGRFS